MIDQPMHPMTKQHRTVICNYFMQATLGILAETITSAETEENMYYSKCKYLKFRPASGDIQSTLVVSNSKGLSEILRDIRTSTYQICRIEEKIIQLTPFSKYTCNCALEVRDIMKILWKRGEIAPQEQFLLFSTIFFYLLLDFHV